MKKFNYFAVLAMAGVSLLGYLPSVHSLSKAEARTECKEQGLKGKAYKSCVQDKINAEKAQENSGEAVEEQAQPEEAQPSEEIQENSSVMKIESLKLAQAEEEELPPEGEEPEPTPEG
ncbi:MAG: hypothetical protein H7A32_04960 [Deltaproteobacteria bacterium]|nr:hypothetical protein [Deltaproteobacteria bacterium]